MGQGTKKFENHCCQYKRTPLIKQIFNIKGN